MAPAERGRKGVPRAGERVIANNALVGGPAACALLGYTVLLGVEVVLLVILALAHLPVRRECLRSLATFGSDSVGPDGRHGACARRRQS